MEQLNNNEYNILVVEDDKEIRDGIEIFLKSQGYHVYKAADGVEGLEVIGRETHSSCNCGYHDAADGWCDHDDQIERTS